jgi:hypothetical protein
MATPIVAGAAALILQQSRTLGSPLRVTKLRQEVLAKTQQVLGYSENVTGVGRLWLS